jgi:hypothetical protein
MDNLKATGLRVQRGMTNGVLISRSQVSATVDYGNDRVKTSGLSQVVQGFDKLFGEYDFLVSDSKVVTLDRSA